VSGTTHLHIVNGHPSKHYPQTNCLRTPSFFSYEFLKSEKKLIWRVGLNLSAPKNLCQAPLTCISLMGNLVQIYHNQTTPIPIRSFPTILPPTGDGGTDITHLHFIIPSLISSFPFLSLYHVYSYHCRLL